MKRIRLAIAAYTLPHEEAELLTDTQLTEVNIFDALGLLLSESFRRRNHILLLGQVLCAQRGLK